MTGSLPAQVITDAGLRLYEQAYETEAAKVGIPPTYRGAMPNYDQVMSITTLTAYYIGALSQMVGTPLGLELAGLDLPPASLTDEVVSRIKRAESPVIGGYAEMAKAGVQRWLRHAPNNRSAWIIGSRTFKAGTTLDFRVVGPDGVGWTGPATLFRCFDNQLVMEYADADKPRICIPADAVCPTEAVK